MNRLATQSLRGFACLLLVAYHIIGSSPEQGLKIEGGWLRILNDALASVRMPLFALIAGSMAGPGRLLRTTQLKSKFERLILPLLTVGTAFAYLQYAIPGTNNHVRDLLLIHIVPVGHFWFLESLFLIFCLVALLENVRALESPRMWLLTFLASVAVYLMHPVIIWFGVTGAIYLLPYFLAGLALTRFRWDAVTQRASLGLLMVLLGLLLVGIELFLGHSTQRFSASALATGLCFSSGLWLLALRNTWLARLGHYSYSIFLFHVFFTAATRMLLNAMAVTSIPIHIGVALTAGILGPIVIYQAVMPSATLRLWLLGERQQPLAPRQLLQPAGLA